jgi:hypothetical protein
VYDDGVEKEKFETEISVRGLIVNYIFHFSSPSSGTFSLCAVSQFGFVVSPFTLQSAGYPITALYCGLPS